MISRSVNLLISLITGGNQKCPPEAYFPINEKELVTLAQKNKALPYLLHFANCPRCRQSVGLGLLKYLERLHLSLLFIPEIFQGEKRKLGLFCQQQKIKVVLIKDFSPYPKLKSSRQNYHGSDIDILVQKGDFNKVLSFLGKNDYKLQKKMVLRDKKGLIFYREFHFVQPKTHIVFDIHSQVAIPHMDGSPILTVEEIKKSSDAIMGNARLDKSTGLYKPNTEDFLLTLVVHYLGSDILKGLRSLYDITLFAHEYEQEVSWPKFWRKVGKLKIIGFAGFIFLLGNHIFGVPKTIGLNYSPPSPRVRFWARFWPVERVAVFPPIEQWKKTNKQARKIYDETFFLKLWLADEVNLLRLLRPKVIQFLVEILFRRFAYRSVQKYRSHQTT